MPNATEPGAAAVPPGAAAIPAGAPPQAAAAPASASSDTTAAPAGTPAEAGASDTERTTIASAGDDSGTAAAAENPEDTGNPPAAQEGDNEDSGPAAGASEDNPQAQPDENSNNATAEAGGAAAAAGEQVASAPPAAAPENAPAAIPPARWPDDLAREMQSSATGKGPAGKVFRSGLQAMQSRDYATAVERLGYLQKKFPHSELTEPAAYFSASALNEMGKYDQAILQYNDLVMRYPKGKYSGEALLREAQDFVQINDKVDARLTLQKLINDQPGTPQAATASAMMKSLESQ